MGKNIFPLGLLKSIQQFRDNHHIFTQGDHLHITLPSPEPMDDSHFARIQGVMKLGIAPVDAYANSADLYADIRSINPQSIPAGSLNDFLRSFQHTPPRHYHWN